MCSTRAAALLLSAPASVSRLARP